MKWFYMYSQWIFWPITMLNFASVYFTVLKTTQQKSRDSISILYKPRIHPEPAIACWSVSLVTTKNTTKGRQLNLCCDHRRGASNNFNSKVRLRVAYDFCIFGDLTHTTVPSCKGRKIQLVRERTMSKHFMKEQNMKGHFPLLNPQSTESPLQ